ncbi:MAG: 3-phosphoshikimate 1-carboxyvinyltransferase [Actinomycetota bacterium]
MSTAIEVTPLPAPPDVTIEVPGSKSHTNRALLCAGLAVGRSQLTRVLFADDTEAMMGALRALGIGLDIDRAAGIVRVDGGLQPTGGPVERPVAVDVRQSGTTGRFLLPVLAAIPGRYVLDGHEQLRARPFGPQLAALRALGATVSGDALPMTIDGRALDGSIVRVDAAMSSQFLSGLLLAAPLLSGTTAIEVAGTMVSQPYVALTTSTMAVFGVPVEIHRASGDGPDDQPTQVHTVAGGPYRPADLDLEPDASAASYFFAAAAITGGRVRVDGLGRDTVQGDLRFVDVLARMGAEVTVGDRWTEVRGTGVLRGVTVDMADISDTAQTLAVVATFADGPTELTGIGFIRHKETDRIGAVVAELNRRGIEAAATPDGLIVRPGTPTPGLVETYADHRMAMSFALLGLRHRGILIDDPGCVAKTFPDYFEVLDRLRPDPR